MKSGFVSIIGRTNAGKSTLINSLLEEKIALVSHKQNATRRKIKAIVMNGEDQIIFIDTPGLHESKATLNQFLIQSAIKSMGDCDVILFVASIFDSVKDYENFLSLNPKVPHIIVLNKVDLADNGTLLKKLNEYAKFSKYFKAILPYSCEIMIKNTKETSNLFIIDAQIITDTNSHKAMLIGKDGTTLKRIGKDARFKISKLIQNKVLLKLFVIVKKNWQKDEIFLKKILNYEE